MMELQAALEPTVKRGDTGNSIETLQTLLNYRGAGLLVDGIFSASTQARLIEFQQAANLTSDGIADPTTWAALRTGTVIARTPSGLVNVRAERDPNAAIVATLPSKTTVKLLTRTPAADENYRWFQVEIQGATGWVREDSVQLLSPFTIPIPVINGVTIQIRPRPWKVEIDPKIEAGIRSALQLGFRDRVRYFFYPLTQDTVLVYLRGDQVCQPGGGCTLLVLQAIANGYRVLSRITDLQQPIIISDQTTHGFPDLIVYTPCGEQSPAYRHLRFNGTSYPAHAMNQHPLPTRTTVTGGIALASRLTPDLAAPLVAV